jgi:hypothetical protein
MSSAASAQLSSEKELLCSVLYAVRSSTKTQGVDKGMGSLNTVNMLYLWQGSAGMYMASKKDEGREPSIG